MKRSPSVLLVLWIVAFGSSALAQGRSTIESGAEATHSNKVVNLRVSPLSVLLGVAAANFQVAVHERVSVGLSGAYLFDQQPLRSALESSSTREVDEFDFAFSEYGLRVDVGLSNSIMADTWYLSSVLRSITVEVQDRIIDQTASANVLGAGAILGYQWVWSQVNLNLGAGFTTPIREEYNTRNVSDVSEDDLERVGTSATLDFNLGIAF